MSRISFSVSMKQDGPVRRPSISLRSTNAMGFQVPGFNLGTLLAEGKSTKKLERDRCEFNVNMCKKNPTLSFVINTTQHVPHISLNSDQVLKKLRGGEDSSGTSSGGNKDGLRRHSSEPRRRTTPSDRSHRPRSQDSDSDSEDNYSRYHSGRDTNHYPAQRRSSRDSERSYSPPRERRSRRYSESEHDGRFEGSKTSRRTEASRPPLSNSARFRAESVDCRSSRRR